MVESAVVAVVAAAAAAAAAAEIAVAGTVAVGMGMLVEIVDFDMAAGSRNQLRHRTEGF